MRAVEIERRRAKLDRIRASDLDEDQQKLWAQGDIDRAARGGEALEFLERLPATSGMSPPIASDAHPTGSTACRCESGHSWSP
jgi:hypothetical protein